MRKLISGEMTLFLWQADKAAPCLVSLNKVFKHD